MVQLRVSRLVNKSDIFTMRRIVMAKKIVSVIVIIVLLIVGFLVYQNQSTQALSMVTVDFGNVSAQVSATGYVKTDNKQVISSKIGGLVESVNFKVSDMVKKGDILVNIDINDIKDQIDQAKANLNVLNAEKVKLLAGPTEEEIKQAKLNVEQAKENEMECQKDFDRIEALFKSNSVAESELDKVKFALNTAKNKSLIAQEQLKNLMNMPNENDIKIIDAKLQQAQLQIKLAEDKLKDATIKSEFDGIVISRNVEKGSYIQAGTQIFQLADLNSLFVQAQVEEKDILNVKVGQKALITGKNLMGKEIIGKVKKISPIPLNTSNTTSDEIKYAVDIELVDKAGLEIKDGMTVDVDIISENKSNVLAIPTSSLIEKKKEYQVFVFSDGKAILRNVKIGIKGENNAEIVEGLKAGEKIVLNPPRTLLDKTKIRQQK